MEVITKDVIELLEKENTKISKKVLEVFDKDVCRIVKTEKTWWFEKTNSYDTIPNYMSTYLIGFMYRKLGLTYLYVSTRW